MGKDSVRTLWAVVIIAFFITTPSCKKERANVTPIGGAEVVNSEIFYTPLIGNNTRSVLLIINGYGDTLKLKDTDTAVADFRKWIVNGKTYYSYFQQNTAFYTIPQVAYAAGYRIVTDSSFRELKRLILLPHNGIDGSAQPALGNHDFLILGENHFITLAYYERAAHNIPSELNPAQGIKVVTPVIQEILNDRVVWQWVGSDYPELYATSVENNEYGNTAKAADYLHVNSMWVDPKDDNLLISCRNSNQLIKLNRRGEGIVWQLGGINSDFEIPDGMQFLRQHTASYINNGKTLMLLDNGLLNIRDHSRVLEFDLDEQAMQITAASAFVIPGDFIRFAGSVQKFGDRYFIGSGVSPGYTPYILEVNYRTGVKTFEKHLEHGSYRAFKYQ
ncbi:MAG TPA: aryl-sulfate sulfotransferase [Flavipsychrobacter sp.]